MDTNPAVEFQTSNHFPLKVRPTIFDDPQDESRRCLAEETPKSWRQRLTRSGLWPQGHQYFPDCERENWARLIGWLVTRKGVSSWFATHTFLNEETPQAADRMYRVWTGRLTQALIHSGGSQLLWIRATEWQIREVIHFHSVIQGNGLDHSSRKRWEDRWETLRWRTPTLKERRSASTSGQRWQERMRTGFCRIYNADPKAAPYLAKYTSKRLGGQIQWGGYWQGLRAPASLPCCQSRESATSVESLTIPAAR
jgi:hypothetical protein